MKNFGLLIVFAFAAIYAAAQSKVSVEVVLSNALQENNEVPFTHSALSWDDFKGKPVENIPWTAMTYSGIKLHYSYTASQGNSVVKVLIYPYMDRTKSWYRPSAVNASILAHEQSHFDITIAMAKKMANALRQMEMNKQNYAQLINATHKHYLDQLSSVQDQYDEETMHGINRLKQRAWDMKIAAGLAE